MDLMRSEQIFELEDVPHDIRAVMVDSLTDDDMALINRIALKPLERKDIAAFTLQLCHNQIDKHYSRFPDEELPKISRMVIGKPLMENHDIYRRLPRGTYFKSRIEASRGGAVQTVCPDVYLPRTWENRDFITYIESGVYRQTSIGFTFTTPICSVCEQDMRGCPHTSGDKYDGKMCFYWMKGVTDVLEGSIVPAGSQGTVIFGARGLPECPQEWDEITRKTALVLGSAPQGEISHKTCSGCGKCTCNPGEAQEAPTEQKQRTPEEDVNDVLRWVDDARKKMSPYAT